MNYIEVYTFFVANSHVRIVTKTVDLFSYYMVVGTNQTYNSHYTSPQTMTRMEVPTMNH